MYQRKRIKRHSWHRRSSCIPATVCFHWPWKAPLGRWSIEYRSVTSQKKIVKLWDLVPFSSKASLEKGPCQKLPLNCNSQLKYKGWNLILPHINLSNFELVPNWRNQNKFWRVCMGCYQTLIPYISIGNCNSELIFCMRASLKILYKNMTSYPIISKRIFLWRHHLGTLLRYLFTYYLIFI